MSPSSSPSSHDEENSSFTNDTEDSALLKRDSTTTLYGTKSEGTTPFGHGNSSTFNAFFHIVCISAGTGTLQLGLALQQSGWIGIILMVFLASASAWTGKLLGLCLYYDGVSRLHGFPEIGYAAFGNVGAVLVQFFHKTTLLGAAAIYLVLSGDTFHTLIDDKLDNNGLGVKGWIAVVAAALTIPLLMMKNIKELTIFSIFGILATVIVAFIVIIAAAADDAPASEHTVLNWQDLPISFASISLAFGGNIIYPHVEHTMAKPQQFATAVSAAMLTVLLLYLPVAVTGYAIYGSAVRSPIYDSLINGGAARTLAAILMTIHVIMVFPMLITTISLEAEHRLNIYGPDKSWAFSTAARMLIRLVIIGVVTIVAVVVPFFGDLMSLLGALGNAALVFILPVVFYYRLYGFKLLTWYEHTFSAIIVVVGLAGGIIGTIQAMQQLINSANGDGDS